jgi:asparagine synthase (glutamine-hydrolysing)
MRFFVCVIDLEGCGVAGTDQRAYETLPRSRCLAFRWQSIGHVSVLTCGDEMAGESFVATDGESIGVGTVRLDNRAELEEWSGCRGQNISDLELVLRTVTRHDVKYISKILGDFAFVIWNPTTQEAIAACDAFAVKKIYYAERNGACAFSSRAEALAVEDRYEVQHLAELVALCSPSPDLSIYAGVRRLPGGSLAVLERGRLTTHRYWSAQAFEPESPWAGTEREAAATCGHLLTEAVRLRLSGAADTWAELSGGIDSSAVVSIAQCLAERGKVACGLAGTVTFVDRQGTAADEREYSDAVVRRWQVRNETIVDPPVWHDERYTPPHTDQPRSDLPFFPRQCRLSSIVRAAAGRVLLTGIGGDELFTGSMFFFADRMARGRIWSAARDMARCAAMGRVSFWELGYRNALLPLLPEAVRQRLVRDGGQVPPWMSRAAVRRYELDRGTFGAAVYGGNLGYKYHHAVLTTLLGIGGLLESGIVGDALDVRHPFLYRPLVEFALRLPPELCARPHQRKWVLREAMRGILPDAVRTRVGKGTPAGLYAWSLTTLRPLLEPLARDSILAELGVVDASRFRSAFDEVPNQPHRKDQRHATLHSALAIEAWLQIRSGRWPRGGNLRGAVPLQ